MKKSTLGFRKGKLNIENVQIDLSQTKVWVVARQMPRSRIARVFYFKNDALKFEASLPISACPISYPCPLDMLPTQSGYNPRLKIRMSL